jgi:hypothetical protein
MSEDTTDLTIDIVRRRERLAANVNELEAKLQTEIHTMTDWRTYVRRYPLEIAAGTFAASMLIGLLFTKR